MRLHLMNNTAIPVKFRTIVILVTLLMILTGKLNAGDIPASQLYQQYCSVCHGEKGDGDTHARQGLRPPPRDFTSLSPEHASREHMIEIVRNGRPGTAMAAWKNRLDNDQITAIVDYIQASFMSDSKHAGLQPGHDNEGHPGQIIYAETCSVCHGDNGQGAVWGKDSLNPPPRDFTTADAQQALSKQRMLASVASGRPGTAMSAYASRLSSEEIEAVVDYIRVAFMRTEDNTIPTTAKNSSTGNTEMVIQTPNLPVGKLANGKALYLQNCTACHGVDGDGKGPRAYFIFPKPRNFLDPGVRASFDRKALYHAIANGVRGREMPAWSKVLSREQISDIAEYVFQTFIQPTPDSLSLKQ